MLVAITASVSDSQTNPQSARASDWNGVWVADGTLFSLEVVASDSEFNVKEVQSLGFVWTAKSGIVAGNYATVEASYAGATAFITVELKADGTATAWAANCLPEFMVVCALVKNRQATFIKQRN
jgi:hypothetical protein